MQVVSASVKHFGGPAYYDNPTPHVSFAWALGDVRSGLAPAPSEDTQPKVQHEPLAAFFSALDQATPADLTVHRNGVNVLCRSGKETFALT